MLIKAGFFGKMASPAQYAVLWSQLFGMTLSAVGFSVSSNVFESKSPQYSKTLGYALIAAGLTCASLIPVSGAWLVAIEGVMMIRNGN